MRSSTRVTSGPAVVVVVVLSCSNLWASRFSTLDTLSGLLIAVVVSYVVARGLRGMPATLAGVEAAQEATMETRQGKAKLRKIQSRRGRPRFQLIAHPINHFFGEKVRWILDLLDVDYEEADVGGIILAFSRGRSVPWLVDRESISVIGNSDEIVSYLGAVVAPENVLCQRTAATMKWEADLNAFGHAMQGVGYGLALAATEPRVQRARRTMAWGAYETDMVPFLDRCILQLCCPVLKVGMTYVMRLHDPKVRAAFQSTMNTVLDKADAALTTLPFLTGNSLTYVDIALASLLGVLLPTTVAFSKPKSLWGRFTSFTHLPFNPELDLPPALLAFEQDVLHRPVGQHVLRLFNAARRPSSWSTRGLKKPQKYIHTGFRTCARS